MVGESRAPGAKRRGGAASKYTPQYHTIIHIPTTTTTHFLYLSPQLFLFLKKVLTKFASKTEFFRYLFNFVLLCSLAITGQLRQRYPRFESESTFYKTA